MANQNHYVCSESQPEPYMCGRCSFRTGFSVNLRPHFELGPTPSYCCQNCDFATFSQLIMVVHHKTCTLSPALLSQSWNHSSNGQQLYYKDQITWFKCGSCPYVTKRKRHIQRHSLCHLKPEEIDWISCDECSYKTKRTDHLKKHKISIHKTKFEVRCETCPYEATGARDLQNHRISEHPTDQIRWFECRSCSYKTKRRGHLQRHLLHHLKPEEIIWFCCDECSYRGKRADYLKKHKITQHTPKNLMEYCYKSKPKDTVSQQRSAEIKLFKCGGCSYETTISNHIKRHMLCHLNPDQINWYDCDQCSYKAKRPEHLSRHKISKHTPIVEINWFYCDQCSYKAKRADHLRKHKVAKHTAKGHIIMI